MTKVKIGTRGSKLALWQAEYVAQCIQQQGLDTEIITINTKGDKILDRSLSKIGSKGVFTEELEDQLRDGTIDIAVHSAKDMQTDLADDLSIIAFSEREKPHDVLIAVDKDASILQTNAKIGTASTRRKALLSKYYPNVSTTEVRGNLQTRLEKLRAGEADALLLAYAGVNRMGMNKHIIHEFDINAFIPAVGQGSIAIEASNRLDDTIKSSIIKAVNHEETALCISTERAFLKKFGGGCSIPVFGYAKRSGDIIVLEGGIVSLNGQEMIKEVISGPIDKDIGSNLADVILEKGGDKILKEIKEEIL